MKTEAYLEEHPVALTEEEKRLRASTASRAWPRMAEQEAAIEARKKEQKEELSTLEGEKRATITRARESSRAAHEGHEPRKVWVHQEFRAPNQVITVRDDTGETVGDRIATEDEIREHEKALREASKAKPPTFEEKVAALAKALATMDAKPHPAKWVTGRLSKACAEATAEEVKAAIDVALEDGRLIEDPDGRLRRIETDEGIVPDDYRPAAH